MTDYSNINCCKTKGLDDIKNNVVCYYDYTKISVMLGVTLSFRKKTF